MKASRRIVLAAVGRVGGACSGDGGEQRRLGLQDEPADRCSRPSRPGSTVTPLITVGDTLASGYSTSRSPTGSRSRANATRTTLDLYVNHETSTRPVPVHAAAPTEANSQNDFNNSQVSHLELDRDDGAGSSRGELRDRERRELPAVLLELPRRRRRTGSTSRSSSRTRRAIDWVNERATRARPRSAPPTHARSASSSPTTRRAARRSRSGAWAGTTTRTASPCRATAHPVVLSGDDAFVNVPAQSQVYSYIADDSNAVWNDEGDLWAFVSDTPGINDYDDIAPGSTQRHGPLRQGAEEHRHRRDPDGTELMAADVGYPAPPNTGWQTANGVGIDGPQWVLEHWSDLNDVFQFTRIEDMAYDKRPGMQNVVYLADSRPRHRRRRRRPRVPPRRTAASGRWCSTRTTRQGDVSDDPRSTATTRSGQDARRRSTSRTTSSRP